MIGTAEAAHFVAGAEHGRVGRLSARDKHVGRAVNVVYHVINAVALVFNALRVVHHLGQGRARRQLYRFSRRLDAVQ